MKKFLKKILYLLIGRYTRTRLFWKWDIIKFIGSNKLLTVRGASEYSIANDFCLYWKGLKPEEQSVLKNGLTKNTDTLSVENVNNFIQRQIYVESHNVLEQNKLFTELELTQQKECSQVIQKVSKTMNKYEFSFLPSECFYGLSGLRWLPEKIVERLKGGIFIDVGAYEGDTAIFFKETFSPNQIYAFEPDNKNFEILQKNWPINVRDPFY